MLYHYPRALVGPTSRICLLILGLALCASAAATSYLRPAQPDLQMMAAQTRDQVIGGLLPFQITPWIYLHVHRGDTLSGLFNRVGLAASQWRAMLALGDNVDALRHLNPGDEFHLRKTPDGQLATLHFPLGPTKMLLVSRTPDGLTAGIKHMPSTTRRITVDGMVGTSFPESLRRAGTPPPIAAALAQVFAGRINLSKTMSPGDRFSIIYTAEFVAGHRAHLGPIMAASVYTQGQYFRAFRYVNGEHDAHYYNAQGNPIKPGIERTPLEYSQVSSPFDMHRVHPILGIVKPHTGVDLAAPRGTPVHAAAEGTVTFVGWMSGYGRMVKIEHAMGYSTRYAHLSDFADTLDEGDHVDQDQTIGYVGASGLATGYHLHFEIRKNGIPHNPLTMNLPSAEPLSGEALTAFSQRIQPLIARLNGNQKPPYMLVAANTAPKHSQICSKSGAIDWLMAEALRQTPASIVANVSCPGRR